MQLKDGLPEGFVLAKPLDQKDFNESVVYKLEEESDLLITRKRDGWKLFAVINDNRVRIFTAGLNEVDARLGHLKKELESLRLPANTVLAGEGLIDIDSRDDITKVISIFQSSDTDKSLSLQKKYGPVKFMIFNIIFHGGMDLTHLPYADILALINSFFRKKLKYVMPVLVLNMKYDQAKELVRKKEWEGLVLYDKNYRISYRLDGKNPQRPKGCYKWKPILEDDFIVRQWIPAPDGHLKEVVLLQIDPATKEEFVCGKLGSFTKKMREFLKNEATYPLVMQIEFEMRFKSGKIRNARFLRLRDDKTPSECIAPKNYQF